MPTKTPVNDARVLFAAGRYEQAEATLIAFLRSTVGSRADYRLLAAIELALGEPRREALALRSALERPGSDDDAAACWARLAALRAAEADQAGAIAAWENALRADPENAEFHRSLAKARYSAMDLDGAERDAAAFAERFPESAFGHILEGHVHKARGDGVAAIACYRRALRRQPSSGESIYNLVETDVTAAGGELASRAQEIAGSESLPAADRINAGFACARLADRGGLYSQAFGFLERANELAKRELAANGIRYDPAAIESGVSRTIKEYPPSSFASAIDELPVDLSPIFVVGLPRSGTTLVEQILASHAEVRAGGELLVARRLELEFHRSRSEKGRTGPVDLSAPADAELLEAARERYVDSLLERRLDSRWVVDKLPANFEIAGFLRLMFPSAPIVHCERDPRATGFSLYNANFGAHEAWCHDLGDIAHRYCEYRRLMSHWMSVIRPAPVTVHYEELVADPANRIPMLLEVLGLPRDPACLDFHRHARPVLTASHAEVRRPAHIDRIDHWRHYADWLGPVAGLGG